LALAFFAWPTVALPCRIDRNDHQHEVEQRDRSCRAHRQSTHIDHSSLFIHMLAGLGSLAVALLLVIMILYASKREQSSV
jgi:hypothetical protein